MLHSRNTVFCLLFTLTPYAASASPLPARAQPLARAVGHWIYHGEQFQTPYTKAGEWTWNEICGLSGNRLDLVCSFDMTQPEGKNHSIAIWSYNTLDKSYWHYEVVDDEKGTKPFISRLTINGDTWTETGENVETNGKSSEYFRVVYRYTTSTRVEMKAQVSADAIHWNTIVHGVGVRQS